MDLTSAQGAASGSRPTAGPTGNTRSRQVPERCAFGTGDLQPLYTRPLDVLTHEWVRGKPGTQGAYSPPGTASFADGVVSAAISSAGRSTSTGVAVTGALASGAAGSAVAATTAASGGGDMTAPGT